VAAKRKPSFGETIISLRREQGLNQADLAARIRREDGRIGISRQYLNDIEHDRRSPAGDHIIREIAKALRADPAFLTFLAGQMPPEIRSMDLDERQLRAAIEGFRKAARKISR